MSSPADTQRIVVVGRGLAGALVAWKFWERDCEVHWWGDGSPSASHVAAGMFNPVSFRRIVEVWNAGDHLEEMRRTVLSMEAEWGLEGQLLHDVPVVKVFANEDYRETWDARWEEKHGVCQWASMGEEVSGSGMGDVEGPAGIGRVHASGWVDVPKLLAAMAQHMKEHGKLVNATWHVADGVPQGAHAVVDCRGVGAAADLASVGVTINPNHGDVLTLSTPMEGEGRLDTQNHNINNGKWLLPTSVVGGRQHWRLGATYSWHQTKPTPQPDAPYALRTHMAKAFDGPGSEALMSAKLESHEAGLRPASPDRRPTAGPWPGQPKGVLMLNGLGTRGVLVGPAMAKHLVAWWLDGTDLPPEILATRFKSVREKAAGFQN